MTTNLTHPNLRLQATGLRADGLLAETFRTHHTTFEDSDAKHVLNAADTDSGGNRVQRRPLRPDSNAMRTGKALAGGTLSGANPATSIGESNHEAPGCAVPSLSNRGCAVPANWEPVCCRGQLRRLLRVGGHGRPSAPFHVHDGQIGRQLSRLGGLAANC
jgi:hypothetical protein